MGRRVAGINATSHEVTEPHWGVTIGAALVLTGALVALFGSTLIWLGHEWWTDEYYAHGPLVPLVSFRRGHWTFSGGA